LEGASMISLRDRKMSPALVAVCTFIGLLLLCVLGFASEGSGGDVHGNARLLDLGYRFLNFALLVIILFVVIRKTEIKDFFSARREEIRKNFDNLKAERDSAEERYRELEKKLKEFETKKKEIIDQFRVEGVEEKKRIIADAEKRAKQILSQADFTIEREIREAGDKLKQEMLDVAARKAEEIIAKEIKDSDQDNLVDEFIERVGKLN
jgi:F-type H+-transporting ATPase subunit b